MPEILALTQQPRSRVPDTATTTPWMVSAMGAVCEMDSNNMQVRMVDAEQKIMLHDPVLRDNLLFYCDKVAGRRRYHTTNGPQSLYFRPDPLSKRISILGPERNFRVANLLGVRGSSVPVSGSELMRVHPFGTPPGHASSAVFYLQHPQDHLRPGFYLAHIESVTATHARLRVNNTRIAHSVSLRLVAPGETDTNEDTPQHLPPLAEKARRALEDLARRCINTTSVMHAVNEALAAVAMVAHPDQATAAARALKRAARRLLDQKKFLDADSSLCNSEGHLTQGTATGSFIKAAHQLQMLACLIAASVAAEDPRLLRAETLEDAMRQLITLQRDPETTETAREAAGACLSTAEIQDPSASEHMRAQGLLKAQEAVSAADLEALRQSCNSVVMQGSPFHPVMETLAALARRGSVDSSEWNQELTFAKKMYDESTERGSPAGQHMQKCIAAAQAVVSKIDEATCRSKYEEVLSKKHNKIALSQRTRAGLAHEAAMFMTSQNADSEFFKDKVLARCVRQDDRATADKLKEKFMAASPELEDREVLEAIESMEKTVRALILRKQTELKRNCSFGDHVSGSSWMEPLLKKAGQVELQSFVDGLDDAMKYLNKEQRTEKDEQLRLRCRAQLTDFGKEIQRLLCRIRLMRRLNMMGTDDQLEHKWNFAEKDMPDNEEKNQDRKCIDALNLTTASLRQREATLSNRKCTHDRATEVVQSFCNATAAIYVPATYLDFLSVLCLAALPPWPFDATKMDSWLQARKRALAADGQHASCAHQAKIIAEHAKDKRGHHVLQQAVHNVINAVEKGLPLADLAACACRSSKIIKADKQQPLLAATAWYWKAASRLFDNEQADATMLANAREALLAAVMRTVVRDVSLTSSFSLVEDPPLILPTLWHAYLEELYGGTLDSLRIRMQRVGTDEACYLALVDTMFFVVTLDLAEVADARKAEQTSPLQLAAKYHPGTMLRDAGASAALFAVAAGTLATSAPALAGLATKVAAGAGLAGYVGTAARQFARQRQEKSFSERMVAKTDTAQTSVLAGAARHLYDQALLTVRASDANKLLVAMCEIAVKQTSHVPSASPEERQEAMQTFVQTRAVQEIRAENSSITAPLFFPLAPPGATSPPESCNGGVC